MFVKICGLSNWIDAAYAAAQDADALGFVMGGKVLPPEVEPHAQTVRQIIKKLPKKTEPYIVTHLSDPQDILDLAEYVRSAGIQISEDIGVDAVRFVWEHTKRKIIKTVPVTDEQSSVRKMKSYEPYCDMILLDTHYGGYVGGTGVTSDWSVCRVLVKAAGKPVILAGGLNPDNLAKAISTVKPAGADVSTGVSEYGDMYLRKDRKDHQKIHEFIRIAKTG